jgi:hypothetical protein
MNRDKIAKITNEKPPCPKCWGFGWWPIGDLCPMGNMDSHEWGDKVIQCPWCENPKDGVKEGERYKALKEAKEKEEE